MAIYNNNILGNEFRLKEGKMDSLGNIIKKETAKANLPASLLQSQSVVKYHKGEKKATLIRPGSSGLGFWNLNSDSVYFFIDTYPSKTITYKYLYTQTGMPEVTFSFTYSIRAVKGMETTLAMFAAGFRDIEAEFHTQLVNWTTAAFHLYGENSLEKPAEFIKQMQQSLQRAAEKAGLEIQTKIEHICPPLLPNTKVLVSEKACKVQPSRYTGFLSLSFDAVLKPDPSQAASLFTHMAYQNQQQFAPLLVFQLEEYIRQKVNDNELLNELQGKVRNGLIQHWNNVLAAEKKGWIVTELQIGLLDNTPRKYKIEKLPITVSLVNTEVNLNSTVILNLRNPAQFMKSGVTNLEQWVQENLEQAAQYILAKVSYAEMIDEFKKLTTSIKDALVARAAEIGYDIEYLMTSDIIGSGELGFNIQFEGEEQNFKIALNDTVKLNVHITGRIKNLNHIFWKERVKPPMKQDFAGEIKAGVLNFVKLAMLTIAPNDFYTAFDLKVKEYLVRELRKLLVEKYNAHEQLEITPYMEQSAIREILQELQKGHHIATLNLFKNKFQYQIMYAVADVDENQWGVFTARNGSEKEKVIEAISYLISTFVENEVQTDVYVLKEIASAGFVNRVKELAQHANAAVRNATGLIIEIAAVKQIENPFGQIMVDLIEYSKDRIKSLMEQLREIDSRMLKIRNADPDLAAELEQQKRDIWREIHNEQHKDEQKLLGFGEPPPADVDGQ